MSRLRQPLTWSQMNAVEHPPLMMKQLFQGVCGGLRWLDTKQLAEYLTKKAMEDGYNPSRPPLRAGKVRRSRKGEKKTTAIVSPSTDLDLFRGITSATPNLSRKKQRLVSYDVLDCTLGGGYHAGAILENGSPFTRVVALDCDPDTAETARDLAHEFGGSRLRFFCSKMSSILSMFGERSFDAVMIDPGPSVQQLEDPVRGFLLQDDNDHSLDMRYGPQFGMPALSYLNSTSQRALGLDLAKYKLLTPEQCLKFGRIIRKARPFTGSLDFLSRIDGLDSDEPLDSWTLKGTFRKAPMPWEFITSLRSVINDEYTELKETLQQALLVVRDAGRVVVFSRYPWEAELIELTINEHPHAVIAYSETIDSDNVKKYGHTRHTKMWVAQRVKGSAFLLKNAVQPIEEGKIQESQLRWMTGLYGSQTHGFPAHNLTFENLDAREQNILKRNSEAPPFDYDDDELRRK
eukprot:gene9806-6882_t